MDMDPQERESENGEESSPVSQNDEDMSDGEDSVRDHEDADSCDVNQVRNNIIAEHGDVLAKLKMQVGNLKTSEEFDIRHMERPISFPNMTEMLHLHDRFNSGPFPFSHPAAFLPPISQPQPIDPSSGSSHSSEGSASSQHTWSFEEQFKQVRQLYEINDDPKRKEFLDDLFSYMQKKGTPINRLPIMAKSVLDLYELYNLVIARGGLVDVINKKLWQEIIKGLHLPSSITSAAFTLRTQYMKYLYPYECSKLKLSSPEELQAAIDGNRREGRRSSYGQYDQIQRSNASQFSPINQQQQFARMTSVMSGGLTFPGVGIPNGVHPSHPQPMSQPQNSGPIPGLAPNEMEARMMKYVEMWNKGMRNNATDTTPGNVRSPPGSTTPLNQYEISRMALWNLYNNNQPQLEPQKEALNLADSPPAVTPPSIKREIESNDTNSCKKNKAEGEARKIDMTSSTNIKINTRGNPQNGDCSLVVTMELNGITYQGVLFAMTSQPNGRTSL